MAKANEFSHINFHDSLSLRTRFQLIACVVYRPLTAACVAGTEPSDQPQTRNHSAMAFEGEIIRSRFLYFELSLCEKKEQKSA